jgi:hypothetical protein
MIRQLPSAACTHATLVLLASLAAAPTLRAQREPATIPTVLVNALLGTFGDALGAGPHFIVGRAPDGWPRAMAPAAEVHVVGGAATGPVRLAVYRYPRSTDPVASYVALVSRAGFKRYEPAPSENGFVSQSGGSTRDMFCGDSGIVTIRQMDSTATTRTLAVTIVKPNRSFRCSSPSVMQSAQRKEPLTIPPLSAPRGVSVQPSGHSWFEDRMELSAQLDTTMSASAILSHYTAQLTAAGWQAVRAPSLADGVAAQQLSTRDPSGAEWRGALLVVTVGDTREVMLRMARPAPE